MYITIQKGLETSLSSPQYTAGSNLKKACAYITVFVISRDEKPMEIVLVYALEENDCKPKSIIVVRLSQT